MEDFNKEVRPLPLLEDSYSRHFKRVHRNRV
jgi:hypothetical protein